MGITAKRLRKGKMKTKFTLEPNLIFEIMSKFQDCPLRSVQKLSGSRQQYHSTVKFRDTCIGFGAAMKPALKLSASRAVSVPVLRHMPT